MGTGETIFFGAISGLLAALLMNLFLRWISASFAEPVNMIKVLGSYVTGSMSNAIAVGTAVHLTMGTLFGIFYGLLLDYMHGPTLPLALFTGIGVGFVHGLLTSYGLMFLMSEKHPVERYRQATFSIGVLYLIAHVVYGGMVGLLLAVFALFA